MKVVESVILEEESYNSYNSSNSSHLKEILIEKRNVIWKVVHKEEESVILKPYVWSH